MPSFSLFGLHQRGEAAAQGTLPKQQHHQQHRPSPPKASTVSTPVRQRIKTGLKDYDSSFRKFIARKLDESGRRNRPAQDDMPSSASTFPLTPYEPIPLRQPTINSYDGVDPLEKHHHPDHIIPFLPILPYSESPPPVVVAASREDSWYTDTTDASVLERQTHPSTSLEMKRFSGGQLPASSVTPASSTSSNRLSRSFKGPERLKKRYSHGSTIRSSFTPSIWSRLSTSSSTSTLSQSVADQGELAAMTNNAGAAPAAAPHEVRDTKRLRLSTPASSSQVNLDGYGSGISSQRQSWDMSYTNAWAGGSGFTWDPPPYDNGRPEIRVLTGNACGGGPESLPGQMEGLEISNRDSLDLDSERDNHSLSERDPNPEPQNQSGKALSIISEACTDASHGPHDMQPSSPDGQASLLVPLSPNLQHHHQPANSFSSHTSDNSLSIRSRITASVTATAAVSTPATSVGDGDNDPEVIVDEDTLSDISEETDGSFIEAFHATSLHPGLLPQVLTLRRNIMSLVEAGVIEWMRSCTGSSGQQQQQTSPSQSSTPGSSGQNGRGVKRSFNDDQSNTNGLGGSGGGHNRGDGGDGDDGPKRRKAASPSEERLIKGPPLACPFVKRYPRHDWPTVCQTGFLNMSRLKEHIYRKHTHPPHCKRCFAEFKNEAELESHAQQDVSCDKASPPSSTIGRISDETRKRVKSRRGIQNHSEHDKWNGVYQILFPGEAVPERPYADFGADNQRSLEELIRFQQQSDQLIRERLRHMPIPDEVAQLVLRSVEEVFQSLRPDSVIPTPTVDADAEAEADIKAEVEAEDEAEATAAGKAVHNNVHENAGLALHLAPDQPIIFSGAQFPDSHGQEDHRDQRLLLGDEVPEADNLLSPEGFDDQSSFHQALWGTELGVDDTYNRWLPNNSRFGSPDQS